MSPRKLSGIWKRLFTLSPLVICGVALVGASLVTKPTGPGVETTDLKRKLVAILERQSEAWNRGDIDAFMEAYWNNEQLTFCSGGNVRRGWTATRDGYKTNYPSTKEMGKLTFSELEVQSLGESAALMLGRWRLDATDNETPPEGNFSLVWRKLEGRWVIVHDHTSLQKIAQE